MATKESSVKILYQRKGQYQNHTKSPRRTYANDPMPETRTPIDMVDSTPYNELYKCTVWRTPSTRPPKKQKTSQHGVTTPFKLFLKGTPKPRPPAASDENHPITVDSSTVKKSNTPDPREFFGNLKPIVRTARQPLRQL